LTTFVGLAMVFVSAPMRWLGWPSEGAAILLLLLGHLATFAGMLALGAVTIRRRVMPLWCGVAVVVGSIGFGGGLVGDWVLGTSGTGYFVAVALLQGVPWTVVGYAVFRAAGSRDERPARVR
jgi:hypothetical protein